MSQPSSPPHPTVNGRPWASIVASGVVKEWGALVVLAGVVGYILWSAQERDKMVLDMIGAQSERHGAQTGRMLDLVAQKIVEGLDRQEAAIKGLIVNSTHLSKQQGTILKNVIITRESASEIIGAQRNFIPIVRKLMGASAPDTVPARRVRQQPFTGTGPQ